MNRSDFFSMAVLMIYMLITFASGAWIGFKIGGIKERLKQLKGTSENRTRGNRN